MPEYQFETHRPVDLSVEIGKGQVGIRCADTTESRVNVTGAHADDVVVEQDGDRIRVAEPRRSGGLFRDTSLRVDVVVPTRSDLTVRTGSADVASSGVAGTVRLRSGSGALRAEVVEGALQAETGSGDVEVGQTQSGARIKSGSGDVSVGRSLGELTVSTGSGDVEIGYVDAPLSMKTGSGDLRAREARADIDAATASGDLTLDHVSRGRITTKGASGDVRVGVPVGVAVWTDLVTVTGTIRSDLAGTGEPADGQDHVELRAKTVSGDITLVPA